MPPSVLKERGKNSVLSEITSVKTVASPAERASGANLQLKNINQSRGSTENTKQQKDS
ncbi:hypothetical protein I7I51_00069 [Histoplasma capsulatum]|uniref:Uncharacterized protein n=1 Tax=Ajellomyces capsulatus TaxID=5037 RepID=A0A8A1ME84_AJECA|nr:predicted protein [Histoplasma mississippiense (nom. inval.)]EDN08449.1 predicted protein [Histoplasma mississippiense (nom. inval.)]QSS63013.1 hypothetical protein I7I51_00069 [Histoplasma capsulatum]